MRTVACFGHSMVPGNILPLVQDTIRSLLADDPETEFLVGNQGQFDRIVYRVLKSLEKEFHDIQYKIVLAYMPGQKEEYQLYPPEKTYYPEGLELVHPKYAITKRNRWMVDQCDIVLCYITHSYGGAAQFVRKAERNHKIIINNVGNKYTCSNSTTF